MGVPYVEYADAILDDPALTWLRGFETFFQRKNSRTGDDRISTGKSSARELFPEAQRKLAWFSIQCEADTVGWLTMAREAIYPGFTRGINGILIGWKVEYAHRQNAQVGSALNVP